LLVIPVRPSQERTKLKPLSEFRGPPQLLTALEERSRRQLRDACEETLATFLREAWPHFESSNSPFSTNWHIDAICEHLEAVSHGQIRRLVINQPPRTAKTSIAAIAWPVWTWCKQPDPRYPLIGPSVRFLCASYGSEKAQQDAVTARRLIGSTWFQERWGDRVQVSKARDNAGQYDTEAGGSRISTGIPESLGKGGAIRLIDDAHKTNEVESALVRDSVLRAYDETWRTRSNDPQKGAEVIIMQRLNNDDLVGHVLEEPDIVHLMLPMEYDSHRHCHTVIGFDDPRTVDGELLWPERFDATWVRRTKKTMGAFGWSAQMQQSPSPRGGGLILREWWALWPPAGQEDSWTGHSVDADGNARVTLAFPELDYVLVSVDTAYSVNDEADWSACTVWGSFQDSAKNPKIILLEAWRSRLDLRALVLKILDTAKRRAADGVLIEAKASGISVMQEMRRLMRDGDFTIFGDVPKGDKTARLHAVSAAFSGGLIFAPDRKYAEMVIEECAAFPRGKHDDLVDSTSAGIKKMRDLGVLQHSAEVETDKLHQMLFQGKGGRPTTVREEYGV